MALLPILVIPEPVLKQVAEPVAEVDDEVRRLLADMLETMYDAPGIGLAAPQIGVSRRLVVVDVAERSVAENDEGPVTAMPDADAAPVEPQPIKLVNPEIVWASEERSRYEEGCLSIPDYYEEVERPARVRVRYLDETGAAQEIEADGLLATCLQHEIDHLDGVLFIDHISRLKRDRVAKRFAKEKREKEKRDRDSRAA